MSFNVLEVARAAQMIAERITPDTLIERVELVAFRLPGRLTDFCIGLRLSEPHATICFSLKQPWVGLYYDEGSHLTTISPMTQIDLTHRRLLKLSVQEGDRTVTIECSGGVRLIVELFPARPNWCLVDADGRETWWHVKKPQPKTDQQKTEASKNDLLARIRSRGEKKFECREFEGVEGSDWLERALSAAHLERREALLALTLKGATSQLETRQARLVRILGEIQKQLKDCDRGGETLESGEALKSVLYEHAKDFRASELRVPWRDGEKVIKLDKKLSLSENADKFFAKYKKLQRAKREIEPRRDALAAEQTKLRASLGELLRFRPLEEEPFEKTWKRLVTLIREKAGVDPEAGLKPAKPENKREKKIKASGARVFMSKEGLRILVGRTHEENEEIVIRIAAGNDMWLHLKGRPGAHAIVQVPKTKSASLETLLDAASLVAFYSGVESGDKIDVDYTFRKYVKRVPGGSKKSGSAFLVTYSQSKTLTIKIDKARMQRLLGSES